MLKFKRKFRRQRVNYPPEPRDIPQKYFGRKICVSFFSALLTNSFWSNKNLSCLVSCYRRGVVVLACFICLTLGEGTDMSETSETCYRPGLHNIPEERCRQKFINSRSIFRHKLINLFVCVLQSLTVIGGCRRNVIILHNIRVRERQPDMTSSAREGGGKWVQIAGACGTEGGPEPEYVAHVLVL